jgi:signal transduction histidine kinase/ligand-binding sensor domain-containing protein
MRFSGMITRSLWLAPAVLLGAVRLAWALDPGQHISQYGHTAWRLQDGIFGGAPTSITQTSDGYLWIGTLTGLLRFDGARFTPFVPPETGPRFDPHIDTMLGTKGGSLWIGTGTGLYQWKDGGLSAFRENTLPTAYIEAIREDPEGNIWITRSHTSGKGGPLCEVLGAALRCYGKADGVPLRDAKGFLIDTLGDMWVASETQLTRWHRATSSSTYTLPRMQGSEELDGINALEISPDGSILVGVQFGRGLGLQTFSQTTWKAYVVPGFDGGDIPVSCVLVDREKSLWIGTIDQGVYRISGNKVDQYRSADGLSSDTVNGLYEDHEGDIWVATSNGIDRFREMRVASFSRHEGLSADRVNSVLAARDGTVWLGNGSALDSLREGQVTSIAGHSLPGKELTSLLEDHRGRLWIGLDNRLTFLSQGKFVPVNRRDGNPTGSVISITEDIDGNVWAYVIGPSSALLRIKDNVVQDETPASEIPNGVSLAPDPRGGIWIGMADRKLGRYFHGHLEAFGTDPPSQGGLVVDLIITADGAVLGASSRGLVAWRDGIVRALTTDNGLPCNRILSLVSDKKANLWLFTQCGLVEVPHTDLEEWWKQAGTVVKTRIFDAFDGVHPGHPSFQPTATVSPDGRLWFANESVVQVVDPAHLPVNALAPPVQIEEVIADHKTYASRTRLVLPALIRDLEIDYTALSFVIPEKVRFRYKLEGHDSTWTEAGARRQAFYTNLVPGNYRFHVIAANDDGVWNETGASLSFGVAPTWYQTGFFKLLCAALGCLVVWTIYRVRVRQISAAIGARFDERMAERTRLARELHDTLLQTIQGSKMVADNALDDSGDPEHMRATMRRLSQWLGQAMQEGRAALNSLRVSVTLRNDLAEAFQRAAEDCLLHRAMEVDFTVIGDPREMHPIARDEVYRIGYEAIRNASTHSGGTGLTIQLTYAQDLQLRVSDNGIGMGEVVAEHGKEGHFGLHGMRERALRIGGRLAITSTPISGTEINLWVPGRVIYRRSHEKPQSLVQRIRNLLLRKTNRLPESS